MGFQIKKADELLFYLRALFLFFVFFFCNLKSLYNDEAKCLGFINASKFSLGGRVVNMEDWLSACFLAELTKMT